MAARPHPFRRYWLVFTVLFGCGLLSVASIGNSQDPQRGADQLPAAGEREKRLSAIEQTLQALLKEVQALRKPDSDTGPATQPAAPPAAAASNGGGRRGQAPPPSLALDPQSIKSLNWRSIGPANMGGRVTAIAAAKNDPSLWWIATGGGGLLKTENNGVTFEHQFDHEATVSIGAVAVAPSDSKVVWVGTGENNPRNSVSYGDGVYRSTDG